MRIIDLLNKIAKRREKMRIIDLLNKIANGEEVPKLIMTGGERFVLIDYGKDKIIYQLVEEPYTRLDINTSCLNDEVEIIEEDKKIEKSINWYLIDENEKEKTKIALINMNFRNIREKLLEIIDYIQEKE